MFILHSRRLLLSCCGLAMLLTHVLGQGLITTWVGPHLPSGADPALNQAVDYPSAIVSDGSGALYVLSTNQNRLYRIAPNGILTIIGGNTYGFGGDDGPVSNARFASPSGLARDAIGNLYVADTYNNRIRKISTAGVITTIGGSGGRGFSGDGGPALAAQLALPTALAVDGGGNAATPGIVATDAAISPTAVALDAAGNLYIASGYILRMSPDGRLDALVKHNVEAVGRGATPCTPSGDGGPAAEANVCFPYRVALDQRGNVYFSDMGRVREITTEGLIFTIAGGGTRDADGLPATEVFLRPFAVHVDLDGSLYIAETDPSGLRRSNPSRIRKVARDGIITTVVANLSGYAGDGGPSSAARLFQPGAIAVDGQGNLYIADSGNHRVRRVSPSGVITTIAGTGVPGFSGDGGPALSAQISPVLDIAVDRANNVYLLDDTSRVRKITAGGVITTIAGCADGCTSMPGADEIPATQAVLSGARRLALDNNGILYIAQSDRIRRVCVNGIISTWRVFDFQGYNSSGFALDSAGGFYIASALPGCRVFNFKADGSVIPVAGTGSCTSAGAGDGGPAAQAGLGTVRSIETDAAGNVYIVEDRRIRRVSASGIISTVAGGIVLEGFSGDGASAVAAQFSESLEIAVDGRGDLYMSDAFNNRIRKVIASSAVQSFSVAALGAEYRPVLGAGAPLSLGYGEIRPASSGAGSLAGVIVFAFRSNGVLVSETSVPAVPVRTSGRIYAEQSGTVRTGLAIANPNDDDAIISFYFTDRNGTNFAAGTTTLGAREQFAAFLDQPPFHGSDAARSFTFVSSALVAAVALRGHSNERNEFLVTTLPVAAVSSDTTTSAEAAAGIVLPHFAAGGGWRTQVLLVNPTDRVLSGVVDMAGLHPWTIAPRSATKVETATSDVLRTGVIRVMPAAGTSPPIVSSVFSFASDGITVTENGIAANTLGTAFRIFAESDSTRRLQTGIALANASASPANIRLEMFTSEGLPSGYAASKTVGPNGHLSAFLNELPGLENLPEGFRGVLRISSDTPITAIGLRTRYNERGEFLISTMPAVGENTSKNGPLFFPHIVSGGGYTSEFILMNSAGTSGATLSLKTQTGDGWPALAQQ